MSRVVFALVAILFLLSLSSITGLIQTVKADGVTIYINRDGSISPSTAPIYTADNITYTLTGNITANANGIVIERNNTVLNGAGYTVSGSGSGNGIVLANMANVTVRNMMITNFNDGIQLGSSSNCTLSGNTVANNAYGIFLDSSSNCTLSGNNATTNTDAGIDLVSSSNNTVSGNKEANSQIGINIAFSSANNTLSGNNVTANSDYGIALERSSDNNTLFGNNVMANTYCGIYLLLSSDNNIYHNNFANNAVQASADGFANVWDNGSSGNYWSTYVTRYPNATQVDSSGVWNTPYAIDANNTDHYPLTVPIVVVPEFPPFIILPLFFIATLLTVIIYKKKSIKNKPKLDRT
jgi:parallel beta-helix repeat protein